MKRLLLPILLALGGCLKAPVAMTGTTNPKMPVDLLFEHDGIKVYRFEDGGRAIYFTDARGATDWNVTHSSKSSYTTHERVETIR